MTWVITDIDGTITDARGRLHEPAIKEMQALEDAGVRVGLISGRPYPAVRLLGEYLGVTGPLIAENGGIGFFERREFVLGSRQLAEDAINRLSPLIALRATWDTRYRETDYALDTDVDLIKLRQLIADHSIEVELQVSSIMLHLAKKGVTKRVALQHCLHFSGIDVADVVVAGDSDSDVSLFEGFPKSIAPANCTAQIRSLAHFRAKLAFGAGFCEGIEHLREIGAVA